MARANLSWVTAIGVLLLTAVLMTPPVAAQGAGYDLSFTAPKEPLSDPAVDLLKVSTAESGSSLNVTVEAAGALEFCCDTVYEVFLGGTRPTSTFYPANYTGDGLSSLNNTTWVAYSYYPTTGIPQLALIEGTLWAGNTTLSLAIPVSLVSAASGFSVEVSASATPTAEPSLSEYSWLGSFLSCWKSGSQGNCSVASTAPTSGGGGVPPWLVWALVIVVAAAVGVVAVVLLLRRRGPRSAVPVAVPRGAMEGRSSRP